MAKPTVELGFGLVPERTSSMKERVKDYLAGVFLDRVMIPSLRVVAIVAEKMGVFAPSRPRDDK